MEGKNLAIMTVYHGGYQPVANPENRIGRNTKDFRPGFYCTEKALKCLDYRGYEEVDI